MEINGENYSVIYNPETTTLTCQGLIRLYGPGYTSIEKLLNEIVAQEPSIITLNFQSLEILNSPGINIFSNFVIKVEEGKISQLVIKGTHRFPWQRRWFKNLKLLMPTLKIEFE